MIDTNALLNVGFTIIASFANLAGIPDDSVPKTPADLRKYIVGSPRSPTDIFLFHSNGTSFRIEEGAVQHFESPGSYFRLQDRSLVPRYTGLPTLSSNQVVELATHTVERLAREGNPIASVAPIVRTPKPYRGATIPFYEVTWPKTNQNQSLDCYASVEIDARNKQVVALLLRDPGFNNHSLATELARRYTTPEPKRRPEYPAISRANNPLPTTNQVQVAISNWLWFCRQLNIDPGSDTNIDHVNWARTWTYAREPFSSNAPLCQITFSNGTCFESVNGFTFNHVASDTCYGLFWESRPKAEWDGFRGKVTRNWEDLAKALEPVLVAKLGIPAKKMARLRAYPVYPPKEETGRDPVARAVLTWRSPPPVKHKSPPGERYEAFSVEFDLHTGDLKSIKFHDRSLLPSLAGARARPVK